MKVLIKATTAAGIEPEDAEGRQITNAAISGQGYRESCLVKHDPRHAVDAVNAANKNNIEVR